jgi:hypothetical protein
MNSRGLDEAEDARAQGSRDFGVLNKFCETGGRRKHKFEIGPGAYSDDSDHGAMWKPEYQTAVLGMFVGRARKTLVEIRTRRSSDDRMKRRVVVWVVGATVPRLESSSIGSRRLTGVMLRASRTRSSIPA